MHMLPKRLLPRSSPSSFDVGPRGFLDDEERDDADLCHVRYFPSVVGGAVPDIEILDGLFNNACAPVYSLINSNCENVQMED